MSVDLGEIDGDVVSTIYRANFRKPDSFFMANDFDIRDGDVIYISNANSVSINKFFRLARTVTGTSAAIKGDLKRLSGQSVTGSAGGAD